MQLTIEEAKGAQSWEKNLLLREILSDGTEDLIELHDCCRQTWVQLFWIQYLKMPIFFCLDMLEIWIHTIFEAQWFLRDPSVFQPFCCVSNVAHSGSLRANTAAAVIIQVYQGSRWLNDRLAIHNLHYIPFCFYMTCQCYHDIHMLYHMIYQWVYGGSYIMYTYTRHYILYVSCYTAKVVYNIKCMLYNASQPSTGRLG